MKLEHRRPPLKGDRPSEAPPGEVRLPAMSSSISHGSSIMVSRCWPFSTRTYLMAWAQLTNTPP